MIPVVVAAAVGTSFVVNLTRNALEKRRARRQVLMMPAPVAYRPPTPKLVPAPTVATPPVASYDPLQEEFTVAVNTMYDGYQDDFKAHTDTLLGVIRECRPDSDPAQTLIAAVMLAMSARNSLYDLSQRLPKFAVPEALAKARKDLFESVDDLGLPADRRHVARAAAEKFIGYLDRFDFHKTGTN